MPPADRSADHLCRPADNLPPSPHPAQMITGLFELSGSVDGIFLPHRVLLSRQYFSPTIPVVSVEQAFAQLLQTTQMF